MLPVVSVVGKSGAGKTTLIEKLISEAKNRGIKVATIKHDAHSFEIDYPGKDSWRHYHAGAEAVIISSKEKIALIERVNQEKDLDELIAMLPPVDLVLTEGYKTDKRPKIEVHRKEVYPEILCREDELIAIATNEVLPLNVPQFSLDDAMGIINLLEKRFLK